ncbi:uncharacterized protein BT62DRAFT_934310 [Guyanagaster necrorhizus]|uniref:Uncharacterized protein n=1 Tax=Guyanagaster necrorhizus TaxID=856835 RepID=A0A9P7VPK0_9AGAR|nr:uncharacterized protein BT62DRAFT_934310 [Guyanagaster necrorhizus MCA 3950]KAG7444135.1 hypothetical protein BT62DRAFT_934310 [Guyanagaster necrorhizus MCA 3950]
MAAISLDEANFLALVFEALLYGSFTVLFIAAIYIIFQKRSGINIKLLSTVVAIWVLSTVHLIIDIIRAIEAFVELERGGALQYYLDLSNPLQAAKTAIYVTLTLVGDGFVIYRCFIVWNRKWYIVPGPLLLLCGTAVGGFGATVAFSRAAPGAEVFLPNIVPWITSFISMTLSTNVVCTSLITYRILSIQRAVRGVIQVNLGHSALMMVVESAAVYSASVLSLMITYTLGSNAQYTVLDLTSPLIGITFTVIILRVSLGISSRDLTALSQSGQDRSAPQSFSLNRRTPVAVNVSHLVEMDSGDYPIQRQDEASLTKHPMV